MRRHDPGLSAVPSGLMLSTTTHISTDIMAMPLLWAIPLATPGNAWSLLAFSLQCLSLYPLFLAGSESQPGGGTSSWSSGESSTTRHPASSRRA